MKHLFIIDIDGTVSDCTERTLLAGIEPSRDNRVEYEKWADAINEGMEADFPVPGMQALVWALADNINNHVVFLTSREERYRKETEDWLDQYTFPGWASVIMRPNGNYQDTAEFKRQEIQRITAFMDYSSIVVMDDDQSGALEQVCDKEGWTFLKARSGGALK